MQDGDEHAHCFRNAQQRLRHTPARAQLQPRERRSAHAGQDRNPPKQPCTSDATDLEGRERAGLCVGLATLSSAMFDALVAQHVTTPDGLEWRVGRQWLTRRWRKPSPWRRGTGSEVASTVAQGVPADSAGGVLVIVGLIALVLIVVPLLLFGIELVIVGSLLAASLLGRVLLRRPWVVQAKVLAPPGTERVLEWEVAGWRRSHRLIDEVVSDLRAGRNPDPGSVSSAAATVDL